MAKEIWKDIAGYEGLYQVSNTGRVMSARGVMSPLPNTKGYLRVALYKDKKALYRSIHSLVMEAFVGPRPKGMHIAHIDHCKKNNGISNLCYCTAKENIQMDMKDGRTRVGEKHPNSKLTWEQVKYIRTAKGEAIRAMARKFGVSGKAVSMVLKGETWKKV